MRVVELRAEAGRATVADAPLSAEDPAGRLWGLPTGLVEDLQEWARVTGDLEGPDEPDVDAISRRGRHLAARLSVALGAPVDYLDPISGLRVALRAVTRTPRPPPVPLPPRASAPAPVPAAPAEPTPWATGLMLAVITAGLVFLANLALAVPMITGLGVLGLVVDVVVAAGLVPALWLNRHAPTWRWAVHGTLAGMAAAVPVLAVAAFSS